MALLLLWMMDDLLAQANCPVDYLLPRSSLVLLSDIVEQIQDGFLALAV